MPEEISVHELLIQLKLGHDEAIEILYTRYAKAFYLYAKGRGLTHEDAEDAAHATFSRVLSNIESYREADGAGPGWLWRICKNVVTDFLRQRPTEAVSEECLAPEEAEPEWRYERMELARAVDLAWECLSQEDREELRRGRGRGPGRKAWHEAVQHLRAILQEFFL